MERTARLIFDKDSINYRSDNGKPWYMYRCCHCDNCGNPITYMFDFFDEKDLNKKRIWNNESNQYCSCCGCLFTNRMEMIIRDVEDVEAQG